MSRPNNPQWPLVTTDKRPIFFNPHVGTQTAPEYHEPWTYSDRRSHKRQRSEVENDPAYTQETTQTKDEAGSAEQDKQPARKIRITSTYRASQNQDRFRISDVGEYVVAWARHIFGEWIKSSLAAVEDHEVQQVQATRPGGCSRQNTNRKSKRDLDPEFMDVMQDMNGEVNAFKQAKSQWKAYRQTRSYKMAARDEDAEMREAQKIESLEDEFLHLRSRYNVLGERALDNQFVDDIRFFTEEELGGQDLPPRKEIQTVAATPQATVEDEFGEEAFEGDTIPLRRKLPVMPGTYPPSPSKHSTRYHGQRAEPYVTFPVVIASKYAPLIVLERTGQVMVWDAMNESTESSLDSDTSTSEYGDIDMNNGTNVDDDTCISTPPLKQPEQAALYSFEHNLPEHLIPARVPSAVDHPANRLEDLRPTRHPTGTADTYDRRRVLLKRPDLGKSVPSKATADTKSNTSASLQGNSTSAIESDQTNLNEHNATEARTQVDDPFEEPEAPNAPSIPIITIEPPSDPSDSSSINLSRPHALLPHYLDIPRRESVRSQQRKRQPSPSNSTQPARASLSTTNVDAGDAPKTGQKPAKAFLSTAKLRTGDAPKPAKEAAKACSSTTKLDGGDSPRAGQEPRPVSKISGLGNSILGKKKNASLSNVPQTEAAREKAKYTAENQIKNNKKKTSDELKTLENTSMALDDATICPDCTFANPISATSCGVCDAAFLEEYDIRGSFPSSNEDEEMDDVVMEKKTFSFHKECDDHIVTYRKRVSHTPANPDHFITGGASPSGTLDAFGNIVPIPHHEAERLLGERRDLP